MTYTKLKHRTRSTLLLALLALLGIAPAVTAGPADAVGPHPIGSDFNGDGYADLAIGAPGETVDGKANAGAVHVLYGTAAGLKGANSQYWTESDPALGSAKPETGDGFGAELATGDFDGDGYDDLAVSAPTEDFYGTVVPDAGLVRVLRGSASGLKATGYVLYQGANGVPGFVNSGERFGFALAAGDVDGDGYADLAIGSPWDGEGTLTLVRGSAAGLSAASGIHQFTEPNGTSYKWFASQLAIADFDGNGRADIAAAVPYGDVGGVVRAGFVDIIRVSADFQTLALATTLDHTTLPGDPKKNGLLGSGDLAAGRIGTDKYAELVIGSSRYDVNGVGRAGQVVVVRGSAIGLDASTAKGLTLGNGGVPGGPAVAEDQFGRAVALGDADGDGMAELAISTGQLNAPKVIVLRGAAGTVKTANPILFTPASIGPLANPYSLGRALAWADANGDGTASLAVGSPYNAAPGQAVAGGVVSFVPGSASFPPANATKHFTQETPGVAGTPAINEGFGSSLS